MQQSQKEARPDDALSRSKEAAIETLVDAIRDEWRAENLERQDREEHVRYDLD